METIGKLSPVAIRNVWPDEAKTFTPWLAKNADLLGAALGMDLVHERTEMAVGQYSADVVFVEESTERRRVVVENMLDTTDHDHLGKLITYAAGLNAGYAVLIAHRFRDEHRSALNWLNSISTNDFGFFGIALEAWCIGDSPPAPQLRIEVQPDNWSRIVRDTRSAGMSDSEQAYWRFWNEFLPVFHEAHPGWSRAATPRKKASMGFPSVCSLLKYRARFCRRADGRYGLRAEARVDTGDAVSTKDAYDALHDRKRQDIEQTLGEELEWERLENNRAARVSLYFPNELRIGDEERWPEARAWLIETMGKMRSAFDPALDELWP